MSTQPEREHSQPGAEQSVTEGRPRPSLLMISVILGVLALLVVGTVIGMPGARELLFTILIGGVLLYGGAKMRGGN